MRSSSGKWFQDGIDPRYVDEFIVGYDSRSRPTGRPQPLPLPQGQELLGGHPTRHGVILDPPAGIPRELYIPYLDEIRDEIGGSSYVIAQLDDAFTDYYEVALEAEYRSSKWYAQGSYVWSQYYGNFDQDNTTTSNDGNIFIGSSFIADGAGRQLWNNRYGYLRGDRRNQFKVYRLLQPDLERHRRRLLCLSGRTALGGLGRGRSIAIVHRQHQRHQSVMRSLPGPTAPTATSSWI